MAADFVIIPTSVNFLDQENANDAISVPMLAKKPFKILMSRIKKSTKEGREIQAHVGNQDISFKSVITERYVIAQSPGAGQWVGQFAKDSDSHKQFLMLANEVILWTKDKSKTSLEEII
jgi:chromosome partitioning protein